VPPDPDGNLPGCRRAATRIGLGFAVAALRLKTGPRFRDGGSRVCIRRHSTSRMAAIVEQVIRSPTVTAAAFRRNRKTAVAAVQCIRGPETWRWTERNPWAANRLDSVGPRIRRSRRRKGDAVLRHGLWPVIVPVMAGLKAAVVIASAMLLSGCSTSDTSSAPTRTPHSPASAQPGKPARTIRVENPIVKQIDGKHRYFFDIRNRDDMAFNATVTITLIGDAGSLAMDTFTAKPAIEPGLGISVYLEASTGPVSVHGSAGVKAFKYDVTDAGALVSWGVGRITGKLEAAQSLHARPRPSAGADRVGSHQHRRRGNAR
jgi:hypothetical protein